MRRPLSFSSSLLSCHDLYLSNVHPLIPTPKDRRCTSTALLVFKIRMITVRVCRTFTTIGPVVTQHMYVQLRAQLGFWPCGPLHAATPRHFDFDFEWVKRVNCFIRGHPAVSVVDQGEPCGSWGRCMAGLMECCVYTCRTFPFQAQVLVAVPELCTN